MSGPRLSTSRPRAPLLERGKVVDYRRPADGAHRRWSEVPTARRDEGGSQDLRLRRGAPGRRDHGVSRQGLR